jgi:hypothetical protein
MAAFQRRVGAVPAGQFQTGASPLAQALAQQQFKGGMVGPRRPGYGFGGMLGGNYGGNVPMLNGGNIQSKPMPMQGPLPGSPLMRGPGGLDPAAIAANPTGFQNWHAGQQAWLAGQPQGGGLGALGGAMGGMQPMQMSTGSYGSPLSTPGPMMDSGPGGALGQTPLPPATLPGAGAYPMFPRRQMPPVPQPGGIGGAGFGWLGGASGPLGNNGFSGV